MRLWATVVLAALIGCGEDARTLTRDDVSGIPAGDAVGSQFSGEYLVASNKIEACHCRVGNCATVTGLTGITTQVLQTDGALQMTVSTSTAVAQGSVNADGSFKAGSALEESGNIQYALAQGRFALSGGVPIRMTGTQEITFHVVSYDCDARSSFISTYVGPLASAFADRAAPPRADGGAIGFVGFAANGTP